MLSFIDGVYTTYWPIYEKVKQGKQEKEKAQQQALKLEKSSQIQLSIAGLKNISDMLSSNRKSDKGKAPPSLRDVEEKDEDEPG